MASSVNNIAATFSAVAKTSSSSSSSYSFSNPHQKNFPNFSVTAPKPISATSWNLHATLPKSQRSSLVNFYGPPGPPPTVQPISTVRPLRRMMMMIGDNNNNNNNNSNNSSSSSSSNNNNNNKQSKSLPIQVGKKVPNNVTLSYLNRNDVVQTVSLSSLCKGKKVAVVGVSAAFCPGCARYVKRVVEWAKAKGSDLIACVAVNDVFVMKAWGENLGVGGDKVMILSDGRGELARAFGVSLDTTTRGEASLGLGVRSRRFCVNAVNGVITDVDFDAENVSVVSAKSTVA